MSGLRNKPVCFEPGHSCLGSDVGKTQPFMVGYSLALVQKSDAHPPQSTNAEPQPNMVLLGHSGIDA